ncbi:MAG TPA: hypothetical protein VLG71_03590, partial [Candidatus Limnocylindria bacterium]|nr:hypothetical protein [Candidatus Limnocylindria bacterium]
MNKQLRIVTVLILSVIVSGQQTLVYAYQAYQQPAVVQKSLASSLAFEDEQLFKIATARDEQSKTIPIKPRGFLKRIGHALLGIIGTCIVPCFLLAVLTPATGLAWLPVIALGYVA